VFAVAASRLWANSAVFLRADAHGYVLPSLRDLEQCNFKKRKRGRLVNSLACAAGYSGGR
jgi:hypothetical protein